MRRKGAEQGGNAGGSDSPAKFHRSPLRSLGWWCWGRTIADANVPDLGASISGRARRGEHAWTERGEMPVRGSNFSAATMLSRASRAASPRGAKTGSACAALCGCSNSASPVAFRRSPSCSLDR